jgi:hypothetical protein
VEATKSFFKSLKGNEPEDDDVENAANYPSGLKGRAT